MSSFFNFCCGTRQKDVLLPLYGDKELCAKHPGMTAMFAAINQAENEAIMLS
jgi:hypothetical protein